MMDWKDEFKAGAGILVAGGVILYPTDIIWGLGSDILNQKAVERIYSIKRRNRNSPLIILASSMEMLKCYVDEIPPRLEDLLNFHEKPLTVIYKKVRGIPDYLLAEDNTVAIRVTREYYSKGLIDTFGRPITSTSANVTGAPFPKGFGDIQSTIIEQVDFISTYKRELMTEQMPSVIVRYDENGDLEFVRN
jgi:L-threonylcarbamoyladenylate synthase